MRHTEDDSPARLGLSSLTFIPGGTDIEKAADLSGNPRFTQLMQTVAPFYDWIVIDSPPVNVVAEDASTWRAPATACSWSHAVASPSIPQLSAPSLGT